MLSELQSMMASLQRLGITLPPLHDWVKPLEKGPFFVVEISPEGGVAALREMSEADGQDLVKVAKDKQNSFPATKIESPLLTLPLDHPARAAATTSFDQVIDAMRQAPLAWSSRELKSLSTRLRRFPEELLPIFEPFECEVPSVVRLLRSLTRSSIDPAEFARQLKDAALHLAMTGGRTPLLTQLLIGQVKKKAGAIEERKITIYLEPHIPASESVLRIAHAGMARYLHRVLLAQARPEANGTCALSGKIQAIEQNSYPEPKLPVLNLTYLFSMNRDTPCHDRYGAIGPGIFPAGKETLESLQRSLAWMTSSAREGQSWASLQRNDNPQSDLLLAWFDRRPDLDADLADYLASQTQSELAAEFETKTQTLLDSLNAAGLEELDSIFHTVVLRRISKGQVQVELSRQRPATRLRSASKEWQRASENHPGFFLFLPPKEKGLPALRVHPYTPRPIDLLASSRIHFIRGGSENHPITGCTCSMVFDLFLETGPVAEQAARSLLKLFLDRSSSLLVLCSEQFTRDGPHVPGIAKNYRAHVLRVFTILGLLLYKLGRTKEVYMNEVPYLLGRMLALSDTLHSCYCQAVRGGSLPPQLLGNQHYAMASERPTRAVAVLGERLRVYKAWADTCTIDDSTSGDKKKQPALLGKWAAAQLGEVSAALHGRLPESRLDDPGKAEMLLGYLARDKRTDSKDKRTETDTGVNENEQ